MGVMIMLQVQIIIIIVVMITINIITIIVIIFTLNKTKFFSKRVMFIIWISSFVGADSQVS